MRRAQNGLSTWVIRHLRDRQLPESDQSRRVRRVGAAIALNSPEDTAHGLPVEGEALLPFLLATLKLTAVGTSTGVVIPEMLTHMRVERGDTLHVVETPEGYLLTPFDPAVEAQLKAGREFMKEYRDSFKVLAK